VAQLRHGRARQVDPIKPTLKAPGIKLLKLKYDKLLSNFAFKFILRRYNMEEYFGAYADLLDSPEVHYSHSWREAGAHTRLVSSST